MVCQLLSISPTNPAFMRLLPDAKISIKLTICVAQADSLTEEQVSEFKEAFSLFVSSLLPGHQLRANEHEFLGQRRRWCVQALAVLTVAYRLAVKNASCLCRYDVVSVKLIVAVSSQVKSPRKNWALSCGP